MGRSPILQAVVLGMLVSGFSVSLPDPVVRFLDLLASAAGPCALFAIGHFLSDQGLPRRWGEVGVATLGKVVLQPALAFGLLAFTPGMDPMWMKSALLLAALPSAANCFVLAKDYDRFVAGASATILLSTIASVVAAAAPSIRERLGTREIRDLTVGAAGTDWFCSRSFTPRRGEMGRTGTRANRGRRAQRARMGRAASVARRERVALRVEARFCSGLARSTGRFCSMVD